MTTNNGGAGSSSPAAGQASGAYGKYFLISVPDFNGGVGPTGPMNTYLRLGAIESPLYVASPSAPTTTGEDLAAQVTSFLDDDRVREGCPGYIPPAERQAETAILHTKGGWRDHTDGNRITTTRGDKVEVIRGNYRMVVMCRQNGDVDVGGWDVSGGHVGESGITYEGDSVIEYTTEEYGGTWSVVEHTRKGHVHSAYHGKVHDYYCGELVESITGTEAPTAMQPNPVVTDTTFALSITNSTGSMVCPVPTMTDTTYALAMESTTYADTMSSTTVAAGEITDSTTAASMNSTTIVGTTDSTTVAGTMTSTTTADQIVDTTVASSIVSMTVGESLSTIVGAETEIIVGNMLEVTAGMQESITLGGVIELTVALMLDICLAGRISIDLGPRVEISSGNSTDINLSKTNLTIKRNEVVVKDIKLSATCSRLAGITHFL